MKKTSKKLKTFHVPITVTVCGSETVRAKNWKEAIKKAREQYFAQDFKVRDSYSHGIDMADVNIDFAEYEDEVEVEDEGVA